MYSRRHLSYPQPRPPTCRKNDHATQAPNPRVPSWAPITMVPGCVSLPLWGTQAVIGLRGPSQPSPRPKPTGPNDRSCIFRPPGCPTQNPQLVGTRHVPLHSHQGLAAHPGRQAHETLDGLHHTRVCSCSYRKGHLVENRGTPGYDKSGGFRGASRFFLGYSQLPTGGLGC